MAKYNFKKIEKKWQKFWAASKVNEAPDDSKKEKAYYLVEFPYPSGDGLHVGHVRPYAAVDVMVRQKRMAGFNVMYPIGWDAFGLPTENYAIKTGIHPTVATAQNVKRFKEQIQSLGISFDWSREINTTDPEYYKWTQWIFLQLYKKDLAYKKKMPINWCPSCKIGLANEEVIDGSCERCGHVTEKKNLEQWLLKITEYADRLIEDLETVDYLDKIKTSQINWIGRSYGAEVVFKIEGHDENIEVFTTRPDTLFGATYMVLAPEHPLVEGITVKEQKQAVVDYQKDARKKSDLERTELAKEKSGVFTGAYAINPVNGEKMQVWIADYVLATYGTGAIMAVPAHDQRDYDFAKKFDLEIRQVVAPMTADYIVLENSIEGDTSDKLMAFGEVDVQRESKEYGKHIRVRVPVTKHDAFVTFMEKELLEGAWYTDSMGTSNVVVFNGKHIVVDSDDKFNEFKKYGKSVGLSKDQLDIAYTPEGNAYTYDGMAVNSDFLNGLETVEASQAMIKWLEDNSAGKETKNYKLRDWVFSRQHYWGEPIPIIFCDTCGEVPVPEDQLPVELPMVEKYEPTDTGESPLADIEEWVNTVCPKCSGEARRETDTMPNWAGSSWYFLRYCDPKNKDVFASEEALKKWMPVALYNGGMEHTTLHLLYSRFWNKFLYDIGVVPTSEPYQKRVSHGLILAEGGVKMSKSKGNVVNPDDVVVEYGADVLRTYEMFMGPYDQPVAWETNGMKGVKRFQDKVWHFEPSEDKDSSEVISLLHQTIDKVTRDIEEMRFNTVVSALMIFMNKISDVGCSVETYKVFLQLLSPLMPHITEELWEKYEGKGSVVVSEWPKVDASLIQQDTIEIGVQVNGKIRDKVEISPDMDEKSVRELVMAREKVAKYVNGYEVKKFIYIPNKMVSIVV